MKYISMEKQEWEREPDVTALEEVGALKDSEARNEYETLAEKGSVLSMINMGHIYEYQSIQDGGPDFSAAEIWYQKAVNAGSAVATFHLGCFYFRRKDYENACRELGVGLERGYAPSIVRLAYFYINGIGVKRDHAQARILMRQASGLGNLWAKRGLARMEFNAGENLYIKIRGALSYLCARVQFYIEKKRDPNSERLRK